MAEDSPFNQNLSSPVEYIVKVCLIYSPTSEVFITFSITSIIILLPLCLLCLWYGLQQWRHNKPTSHSDNFTYHLVVMELLHVVGSVLCCCGIYIRESKLAFVGFLLLGFTWIGQTFFNILTCVERYLAVIFPVTYLKLRSKWAVHVRNLIIGCVWLLCGGGITMWMIDALFPIFNFSLLLAFLPVILFCSFSVLHALIRKGPGEQPGIREKMDQSKKRAFYTIMAILFVMLLSFTMSLLWAFGFLSLSITACLTLTWGLWCNLPSSLVLPVLFVCREGKLLGF